MFEKRKLLCISLREPVISVGVNKAYLIGRCTVFTDNYLKLLAYRCDIFFFHCPRYRARTRLLLCKIVPNLLNNTFYFKHFSSFPRRVKMLLMPFSSEKLVMKKMRQARLSVREDWYHTQLVLNTLFQDEVCCAT